jgi:hypothetical protein
MNAGSPHTSRCLTGNEGRFRSPARALFRARRRKWGGLLLATVLIWLLNAATDDSIGTLDWLASDLSALAVFSLLRGFMPIILSGVFILVATVLYIVLLCSIEQALSEDGDDNWDAPDPPRTFTLSRNLSARFVSCYISLKEHSPPLISALTQ